MVCNETIPKDFPPIRDSTKYLLAFSITLPAIILLWGMFLACKLYYGKYQVNKLTFMPLKWAAVSLSAQTIYSILTFLMARQEWWYIYNCPGTFYNLNSFKWMLFPFILFQYYAFIGFISSIFFEQMVLWTFVVF